MPRHGNLQEMPWNAMEICSLPEGGRPIPCGRMRNNKPHGVDGFSHDNKWIHKIRNYGTIENKYVYIYIYICLYIYIHIMYNVNMYCEFPCVHNPSLGQSWTSYESEQRGRIKPSHFDHFGLFLKAQEPITQVLHPTQV